MIDLRVIMLMCAMCHVSLSLRCYMTLNSNNIIESEDPSWQYCVFTETFNITSRLLDETELFGLGPGDENLDVYASVFDQTTVGYRIMSNCVFEEYHSFDPSTSKTVPETKLRCLCNTDFCNRGLTLQAFLDHLAKKSALAPRQTRSMRFF